MPKRWAILAHISCQPSVIGRPKHQAEMMSASMCRLKWLAGLALLWEILGLVALVTSPATRALMLWYPWSLLVTHIWPAIYCVAFLALATQRLSIRRANWLMLLFAVSVIASTAVLAGAFRLSPVFMPAYCLALLGAFVCTTLSINTMVILLVGSMMLAYATSIEAGLADVNKANWLFTHSMELGFNWNTASPLARHLSLTGLLLPAVFAGSFGIVINTWALRAFRNALKSRYTIERQAARLALQKLENDRLLDRALTAPVAKRLRETGDFPPSTNDLCVIVCDVVGFTEYCQRMPAQMIVSELHRFFTLFDECCMRYGVEPLRSQGDCRLAVGGLAAAEGRPQGDIRLAVVDAVMAMLAFRGLLRPAKTPDGPVPERQALFQARIGIHSGPVMMGVMSGVRISFDVWGDTVNQAARLQQAASVNQILVSEQVLWASRGLFEHGPLGPVHVKNLLVPSAAEIRGIKAEFTDGQGEPNDTFRRAYQATNIVVPPRNGGEVPTSLRVPAG